MSHVTNDETLRVFFVCFVLFVLFSHIVDLLCLGGVHMRQ